MALAFDLAGFRAAKDKGAWYRQTAWNHLETALRCHQLGDDALADEHRRTAEAMFARADEAFRQRTVVAGTVVTDSGELPAPPD
jgi:hypothetical protein